MAQLVLDGQLSFEGGQDSSLPPSRLPENRIAAGVNIITSRGVIRPRYGVERKSLTFPRGGYAYRFNQSADFKKVFHNGKFQALAPYSIGTRHYLVVVISGVIFLINQDTLETTVLTIDSETQLNEFSPRINWGSAGRFLVLHDFPHYPVIIEGQSARRADQDNFELPASTMGIYNQNRYFFSNSGNEFSAGDPVGNPLTPDAPITAEEIMLPGSPYFAEIYQAAAQYNSPITAMANLKVSDSSTGIGPLLVGTRKEIFVFNTIGGRQGWISRGDNGSRDSSQFGKAISDNAGIAGPRAFVNVASDLFFVSQDGQLRSFTVSLEEQRKWARVPMNVEISNWISYISDELIPYTFLTYFKNRIFWSARPYRMRSMRLDEKPILDVAHSGFVVLSTDNVSRLGVDSAPSWDGLWTGVHPMDACVTNERMFVMSKDSYSRNELYEVDPELKFDRTQEGHRRQIQGTVYTRSHIFQNQFAIKDLKTVEFAISEIAGKFELVVEYKPSHSSRFHHWTRFSHEVPVEYRLIHNGDIRQRSPISFRELKFGFPESIEGHPITQDLYDRVKEVQLRISLTGDRWQLDGYKLEANAIPEQGLELLDNLKVVSDYQHDYNDWQYEEFGIGEPAHRKEIEECSIVKQETPTLLQSSSGNC